MIGQNFLLWWNLRKYLYTLGASLSTSDDIYSLFLVHTTSKFMELMYKICIFDKKAIRQGILFSHMNVLFLIQYISQQHDFNFQHLTYSYYSFMEILSVLVGGQQEVLLHVLWLPHTWHTNTFHHKGESKVHSEKGHFLRVSQWLCS